MYNLTIFVETDFSPTVSWIENDGHIEFAMADNHRKAEYATYCFLYLHNLMAYCVEVDVHTGHNPPP